MTLPLVSEPTTDQNFRELDTRLRELEQFIFYGQGSPEGVVLTQPGAIYFDLTGGAGSTIFSKESGTGNTGWVAVTSSGAPPGPHALLSATHTDSVASTMTRGDLIVGTAGGWDDLAVGGLATFLRSDGTDPAWATIAKADLPASIAYEDEANAFVTPAAGQQTITGSGAWSASTSVGGLLNVTTTGGTGAGLVVYSNRGADAAGRLAVFRSDNADNPQQVVRIENDGESHALSISHTPNGSAGDATAQGIDVVSDNRLDTTVGILGVESGRATLKITHDHPAGAVANDDSGAACLRLSWADTAANGTAAQGIFMSAEPGGPTTTGDPIDIYPGPTASTTNIFKLTAVGQLRLGTQGSTGGLLVGGDVALYRDAADRWAIGAGDSFVGRTVYGGTGAGDDLHLYPTTDTTAGAEINLNVSNHRSNFVNVLTNTSLSALQNAMAINSGATVALNTGGRVGGLVYAGTYTIAVNNPGDPAMLVFNWNPTVSLTSNTADLDNPVIYRVGGNIQNNAGANVGNIGGPMTGYDFQPNFNDITTYTGTIAGMMGFKLKPVIGTGWTLGTATFPYYGVAFQAPAGAGTLDYATAILIESFTGTTLQQAIRSEGVNNDSIHAGPIKIGANSAIGGVTAAFPTLELERSVAGVAGEGYAAALTFDPAYTTSNTVTIHNYTVLETPTVSGTAAVTDAAVMRFDAAAGTHKAVDSGTTKTTPGTVDAWVKVNVNGTLHYLPAYTSKTT